MKRRPLAGMSWRSVAIAGGAAAIGIIALVAVADPAPQLARYTIGDSREMAGAVQADPLRTELARCRTLLANTDDARCSAAWEVNRRRFMGESRSSVAPMEPPIAREPIAISQAGPATPANILPEER